MSEDHRELLEAIEQRIAELLDRRLSSELSPQQHAEDHALMATLREERTQRTRLYQKVREHVASWTVVSIITLLVGACLAAIVDFIRNIKPPH